jgi:hypothetical protein
MSLIKFIIRFILGLMYKKIDLKIESRCVRLIHSFSKGNNPAEKYFNVFDRYTDKSKQTIYIDRRRFIDIFFKNCEANSIRYIENSYDEAKAFIYHYYCCKYLGVSGIKAFFDPMVYEDNRLIFFLKLVLNVKSVDTIVTPAEFLAWEFKLNLFLKEKKKVHVGIAYSEYSGHDYPRYVKFSHSVLLVASKRSFQLVKHFFPDTPVVLYSQNAQATVRELRSFDRLIFVGQSEISQNVLIEKALSLVLSSEHVVSSDVTLCLHPLTKKYVTRHYKNIFPKLKIKIGLDGVDLRHYDVMLFSGSTAWQKCQNTNCFPLKLLEHTPIPSEFLPTVSLQELKEFMRKRCLHSGQDSTSKSFIENNVYWG